MTDLISELPIDLRRRVASAYNWNWILVPTMEASLNEWIRLRLQTEDLAPRRYRPSGTTASRVFHWLRCLRDNANDPGLPYEAELIIMELSLHPHSGDLIQAFKDVVTYNRSFFDAVNNNT